MFDKTFKERKFNKNSEDIDVEKSTVLFGRKSYGCG